MLITTMPYCLSCSVLWNTQIYSQAMLCIIVEDPRRLLKRQFLGPLYIELGHCLAAMPLKRILTFKKTYPD